MKDDNIKHCKIGNVVKLKGLLELVSDGWKNEGFYVKHEKLSYTLPVRLCGKEASITTIELSKNCYSALIDGEGVYIGDSMIKTILR